MNLENNFQCMYEVDDGYAGKARPQFFTIEASDIYSDMDEGALIDLFCDVMREEYEQKISPIAGNMDEFLEWAKKIIEESNERSKPKRSTPDHT